MSFFRNSQGSSKRHSKISDASWVYMLTCRNCGGGDRGRVAIYRPFGEFRRAKIALSPVWCSRPTTGVPLAHATMNFVGLDLTTSDSTGRLKLITRKSGCPAYPVSGPLGAHPKPQKINGIGGRGTRRSVCNSKLLGMTSVPQDSASQPVYRRRLMKSNRFTGSVELSGKFSTRLTTVLLQGFVIQGLCRPVRDLSQRDKSPDLNF
ncbi:hypothetical protein TNCV_855201 [Trichonephila clavipes]|nr:hypothetical protein TNCV_855201 [Trichonephila clavipes]